jgi:hypothetical protein
MLISMLGRHSARRVLVRAAVQFFVQELNLERSRYTLNVQNVRGLYRAQQARGGVVQEDTKSITMLLEASMDTEQLIQTIAHEMIHVKQIARGRLTCFIRDGEIENCWLGKKLEMPYHLRPWEVEAFKQEKVLAYRLFSILTP